MSDERNRSYLDRGAVQTGGLDRGAVQGQLQSSMAAFRASFGGSAALITLDTLGGTVLHSSSLLEIGEKGEHGDLVLRGTPVFWEVLRYARENGVEALHREWKRDPRRFEEFIAGTYAETDARIVELSPFSGDGGVDVWAVYEIPHLGDLTVMDQVKLYAPDRAVNPADVSHVLEGRGRAEKYSKAVLSTTGRIPRSVHDTVAHRGERVILRGPEELQSLLADLDVKRQHKEQ